MLCCALKDGRSILISDRITNAFCAFSLPALLALGAHIILGREQLMNKKQRLLSWLLTLTLIISALPLFAAPASADTAGESYTKNKVVSVLFDNSGSMTEGGRWDYARYALQTLMAVLGKNDTLIITPMNTSSKASDDISDGFEVNLAAENRDSEINRIMTTTFLGKNPNGYTPAASIPTAIAQLTARGMKTTEQTAADEVSKTDYILLVLTDGVFTDGNNKDITDMSRITALFEGDLSKYASFQSLFLSFTPSATDLRGQLTSYANFAAFKAAGTDEIGAVMQSVANRITGRYPLAVTVDPSASTLRISLSDEPFSLRTVTLMVLNSNARFDSLSGATYGGEPLIVQQNAAFGSTVSGMNGGFSLILERDGAETFSGGEILLPLDAAPGADASVSVLLEPALTLRPKIEVDKDGVRTEVDASYINSNLTKNDGVYISYTIVEQGSGRVIDPASIGGKTKASVTYNTKNYDIGTRIPLVNGKKEISLSVSVMDGAYTLYTSFPCVVLENPTYFRIEAATPSVLENNAAKTETLFTVYDYNAAISSLAALESYAPTVTATAEDGTSIPASLTKKADGRFSVVLDVTGRAYGTYTLHATVKSPEGNPRSLDVPVPYYPSNLILTHTGPSSLSMTLHGLKSNTEAFTVTLAAGDTPIAFDHPLIEYRVTVGTVDVTEACIPSGATLSFLPTDEVLAAIAEQTGSYPVKITARMTAGMTAPASLDGTLELRPIVYEIVPLLTDTPTVDRFGVTVNEESLYFRVLRDGAALSEEELTAALADGTFTVDRTTLGNAAALFFNPLDTEQTVVTYGGTAAVRVRICSDQITPLADFITSMFIFGDSRTLGVSYLGVTAEQTFELESSFFSYVWRILLIAYIIQLIILLISFKSVKRVPQGTLIKLKIEGEGEEKLVTRCEIIKHIRFKDTLLLSRVIPFVGFAFREKTVSTGDSIVTELRSEGTGVGAAVSPFNTGEFTTHDGNKPILSSVRQKFKEKNMDGNIAKLKEKGITVAVKTEAKKMKGIVPLGAKRGYVPNPASKNTVLYLFVSRS